MLFPQESYNKSKTESQLLHMIESCYTTGSAYNQAFQSEATLDSRIEAGDQTVWPERFRLTAFQRKMFNFNRIRRIVEMQSGHQRKNRKSITVVPRENGDIETADQFSKLMLWVDDTSNISGAISDAFHGALITGLNLLHVWVDYSNDPLSGDIKIDVCPYNEYFIDPYFRKRDLSDCNYVWKRSYLTTAEAIALMPDHAEEIQKLPKSGDAKDGKFMFMPENFGVSTRKLIAYDEFYYKTIRDREILVDTQTNEALEFTFDDKELLKRFLKQYPQVKIKKTIIPTVNLVTVLQGRVFYNGRNPQGLDNYPFVPVFAYFNPQLSSYALRVQGVVRSLRDAQFLYNRRKVLELAQLESQLTSGYIYKENALLDVNDIYKTGEGKGIGLKSTAQMTDIQRIEPPQIPPTTIELSKILANEMQEISGVSEELLGAAADDKAGILSMLRQGASLTTLQSLFDNLDMSQKLLGKIIIKIIQNNFSAAKVARIIEQEPTPKFYNKNFGMYDCVVEDGVLTSTQRQMALSQALHLREAGVQIPDEFIIENITIQKKPELIKIMQQQKEAAQQQQQQMQEAQLQEMQMNSALAQARVEEQKALASERSTRSISNLGLAEERRIEAVKDLEQAKLDKIRQFVELEKLDLDTLNQILTMMKALNQPLEKEIAQDAKQTPQESVGDIA